MRYLRSNFGPLSFALARQVRRDALLTWTRVSDLLAGFFLGGPASDDLFASDKVLFLFDSTVSNDLAAWIWASCLSRIVTKALRQVISTSQAQLGGRRSMVRTGRGVYQTRTS